MAVLLKVDNLSAAYGGIHALRGVSLEVQEGEIVAVLGANGAGKSTLLKHSYEIVAAGVVQVPEARQIFAKLTVYENLRIGSNLRKDTAGIKEDMERVYSIFPRLKEREKQYGGLLSGGEQQMLAIARGMMARPKLMIFDEPSLGLAPVIVQQVFDVIQEINREGVSVMLIEQNAQKALGICDHAYIMQTGKVVAHGTGRELLTDESMVSAYLGE